MDMVVSWIHRLLGFYQEAIHLMDSSTVYRYDE